jgi:putative CocE/NonD family hydrolase
MRLKSCALVVAWAAAAGMYGGRAASDITVLAAQQPADAASAPSDVVLFAANVLVPMRDGVRLATDIYRPALAGVPVAEKLPVLLQRTPYNKDAAAGVAQARYFASHGYVVALQDERGAYHSEGVQSKYIGYGQDGYDTIEWLATQPYTDGQVAMWGTSYAAHAEAGAAILHPPHLRTVVLNCGGLYNGWLYKVRNHGAFELAQQTTWAFGQLAKPESAAPWIGRMAGARGETPLAAAPSFEDYYFEIMTHADYDDYWKQPDRNWSLYYEQTSDIPMLHLTGWYDSYTSGSILNFQNLSKIKKSPVQLIIGPWVHGGNTRSNAGDVEFGPEAAIADFDGDFHLRWFDRFLKGRDTGADREPAVRLFVMGTADGHKDKNGRLFHGGYWRTSSAWPLPDTTYTQYYLHGDGSLTVTPPGAPLKTDAPTAYSYDPSNPVPTVGGSFSGTADLSPAGAFDQHEAPRFFGSKPPYPALKARPDVAVFQTAPLAQDTEVVGPVVVRLFAGSNAPDTDFTAKLVDVYPATADYPSGFEMNLTDGIVRARYRNSPANAEMLKAGQAYEFEIDPFPTANVFKKGHRIRVDISSSNFPRFDVNPNTGEPLGQRHRMQISRNLLYHDAAHPSAVVLPVVPHAQPPAGPVTSRPQPQDRFATVNGLRLHYLEWGAAGKPPLVMVHGIARHAHTFDHIAADLARDYRVIAIDMRGHGDSAWSPEGAYLVEDHVKDLEGLVGQLQLRRLTLLGNSTGGRVVQVFAGLHPDLVERVIVEDVGPERPQEIASGFARRVQEEADGWASEDELVAQLVKQNARTPEPLLRTYAHYGVKRRADGRLVWKRDPNLVKGFVATELWQAVSRITAPTLYILGGASAIVPSDTQRRLKQTLPNCEIVTMPGLGHYPDSEDPAGFMTIVNRFLERSI